MKVKKILLLGCFVAAALTTGFAQEGKPETLSLSLDQAEQYALSYNRNLKSAGLEVEKANKAKWQSIATMLPHATGTLAYNNFLGYEMEIFEGMEPTKLNPSGDLTIQATMAVSGVQIVATQLSKIAAEMSETNRSLTELDIKGNVMTSYMSVLIAEESRELLENTYDNMQRLYKSTSEMYAVGMAEQTDVDLLEVQLGTLENNIRSVDRNIELAYNSLKLLLGSNDAEIILTESLDNFLDQSDIFMTLVTPLELDKNYNVRLLDQNIKLSTKQLTLNKWEYGPTLSAFYQYYDKTNFGKEGSFNMNPPNTVGATLSIPIFSSGERLSKVQQARFDLQMAKLQKEEAVQGLLIQEKQLRFNLKSAIETYEVQRKNVNVYERIFKNSSQKYELGVMSSTDLTTISNNLISAQSSYINSLMELISAQVELRKLLNQL